VRHRRVQNRGPDILGRGFLAVACVAVMAAAGGTADAPNNSRTPAAWEGWRANLILLDGDWEFSAGDGSERAESPASANRLHWQPATLPGPFMPWSQEAAHETKVIWARRSFKVTAAQARGLAVLRWNRIACGAAAFINGQHVGANEPTGPFQGIVPGGVLRSGDNQIVLKIRGAAGWMGRLWNHPAVVMWVLSNESNRDSERETGPYHGFVRALDPTRPTMRTGDTGTAENYDVHTCGNVEDTVEGNLIPRIPSWFDKAKGRPVTKWSYDFMLNADTLTKTPITWRMPDREGSYWLTARTTGIPGRAVLSQRFVRAVQPPEVPATLRDRRFVILGGDAAADTWFQSRELPANHDLDSLVPQERVVVIWNAAHLTPAEKRQADVLRKFAAAGGQVVVLATRAWDWTELCDIKVGEMRGSRAFLYPDAKPSMLADIRPDWLMRWNGLPGTVAVGSLDGPALAAAEKILCGCASRRPAWPPPCPSLAAKGRFFSHNGTCSAAWTVRSQTMIRWPRRS
jgi:hypothetical protein